MQLIENKTFDDINVGDQAELVRTLTPRDIDIFAIMSGDVNPAHVDPEFAEQDIFHKVIAHGMWGGALISTVLGTQLPGPGTIYIKQNLKFLKPVTLGDTLTVTVTVIEKIADKKHLVLECVCKNDQGKDVIRGEAKVMAPTKKVSRPKVEMPDLYLHQRGAVYDGLLAKCKDLEPIRAAIVHPCDENSLEGAIESEKRSLLSPILVGPEARIKQVAKEHKLSIDHLEIVDTPYSHASAVKAVELVRSGKADGLMKGALHTDEIMSAVVDAKNGLRTERRMSHIYLMDVPTYPKPLLISDAAININPDLVTKADIVQNAIDLAHAICVTRPKVALLSAVETIYPPIKSTVEAGALCKMADRGQIKGAILDGPLAFDNAISKTAAADKGIMSLVAGDADILITPDLEAGNMVAKQLIYLAGAEAAGIVLGARAPIMLTSRSDKVQTRIASAALAKLFVHHKQIPSS